MPQEKSTPIVAVVDHDEAVRDSLTALLETAGVRVMGYSTPDAFIASREPRSIQCLLVDLNSPNANGLELVSRVHARDEKLPVVAMTWRRSPAIERRARAAGASAVLEKPLAQNALFDALAQALGHSLAR